MDINADGLIDVLSGSYSRTDAEMAGLFQVLYGAKGGGFMKAKPLTSDGEAPLVVTSAEGSSMGLANLICTRPFAADLDADGLLDLVTGDFDGSFAFIEGLEDGHFAADPVWLKDASSGQPLRVALHSDPVLVDWDSDGDLDLVSGADDGSVSLFYNVGTPSEPRFASRVTLLKAPEGDRYSDAVHLGDAHLVRPQHSTRVAVADVNSDGKQDLLIGDSYSLQFLAEGVAESEMKTRLAEWEAAMAALQEKMPEVDWPEGPEDQMSPEDQALIDTHFEAVDALQAKRAEFLREESTGSVWLMLHK